MPKTYIIGHTKPDTDAVVAAMALEYLYNQKVELYEYEQVEAVVADPLNPETKYLFDRFDMKPPLQVTAADILDGDQVVLVDHNEADQRLEGITPDQIDGIVDHHKVNLNLPKPIYLLVKPWGSTSTIVYFEMEQLGVKPNKKLASLMLAAVLSDTVGYKSATTTEDDKIVGEKLAKIAGIEDIDSFVLDIFKAKSDISNLSAQEIVLNDYKIFDCGGKKVLIDQLETVEQAEVLATRKAELLEAMEEVKADQGVDLIFVAISDVLKVNTKLLLIAEEETEVAEKAFGGQANDKVLDIGAKLSRKKEIAPPIEAALK